MKQTFQKQDIKNIIPLIKGDFSDGKIPEKALCLTVGCNNWPEDFPYSPDVKAYLWHDKENLFIKYEVNEEFVRAIAEKDNSRVCEDSCVEFFISFDNDGYYNIETNCTGKILFSHRKGRKEDVTYGSPSVLSCIKRVASLGSEPFDTREQKKDWDLFLKIPVTTFFKHSFSTLSGIDARCNVYKCGDLLPRPHYLSWQPIDTPKPDFHRPEFFGAIFFQ